MEQTCGTCRWWHQYITGQCGECRNSPPAYLEGLDNCFPATSRDAFCGLWTPNDYARDADDLENKIVDLEDKATSLTRERDRLKAFLRTIVKCSEDQEPSTALALVAKQALEECEKGA